jgi:hypothetical protein
MSLVSRRPGRRFFTPLIRPAATIVDDARRVVDGLRYIQTETLPAALDLAPACRHCKTPSSRPRS